MSMAYDISTSLYISNLHECRIGYRRFKEFRYRAAEDKLAALNMVSGYTDTAQYCERRLDVLPGEGRAIDGCNFNYAPH